MSEALHGLDQPSHGVRFGRRVVLGALACVVPFVAIASPQHYRDDYHSANEASRIYATLAIVDHGTLHLEPVFDSFFPDWRERGRPPNADVAWRDGHYVLDKAPGISLAAVPVAWAMRAVGVSLPYSWLAWLLSTLFAAVPTVIFLLGFQRWLERELSPTVAVIAPALVVATPWLVYGAMLFGHAAAAALVGLGVLSALGGLGPADERRSVGAPLLGGLLLGLAVLVEYPAAIVALVVVVGLAVDSTRRWRLPWLVLGGLGPGLALVAWNTIAFGGPLAFSYGFKADAAMAATHGEGFYGFSWPQIEALFGLILSARRGLLFMSPWLALGLVGSLVAGGSLSLPRAWRIVLPAVLVSLVVFFAGYDAWPGGRAVGPRHLSILLPCLGVGAALLCERLSAWSGAPFVRAITTGLVVSSLAICFAGSLGFPYVSPRVANPIFEVSVPVLFLHGPGMTIWDGVLAVPVGAVLSAAACVGLLLLSYWRSRRASKAKTESRRPSRVVLATVVVSSFVLHLALATVPTTGEDEASLARIAFEREIARHMRTPSTSVLDNVDRRSSSGDPP